MGGLALLAPRKATRHPGYGDLRLLFTHVADSFSKSRYLRRFPRVVVYNGVKPLSVAPHFPREIVRDSPFTLGMVARLDNIKDHSTLLRAFALLIESWPTARLELVGDGERRPALEKLALDLGISSRVRFLGMIADVYSAMAQWDLFVYATTAREGLGNALAEAMMFGLPSIVTDTGPMSEVAGDPPTVLLVPPHNPRALSECVTGLVTDCTKRRKLSLSARTRAEREFSRERFSSEYVRLLTGE